MQVTKSKLKDIEDLRSKTIMFGIFLLIVIIASIFIIRFSIIVTDDEIKTEYSYNSSGNVNYSTRYIPNNLFEETIIGMNQQLATEFVDTIEVDFSTALNFSKEVLVEYDYEIIGIITGTYSSDSSRKETELWTRNFTLLESKSGKVSDKNTKIKEKIALDFNYYNNIVVDFKRQLKLNIDAKFTTKMIVNYKIKVKDEVVEKTVESTLEFPLNKAAFFVTAGAPKTEKEVINVTYEGETIINYPVLIAAIIFLIVAIVLLIKYIIRLRILTAKTEYQKLLAKYLKDFGDIIVESKTPIDAINYEILEIHDFNDLVDAQNEVRVPIVYYEKTPDMEGWFVLVHGNLLYRYVLYTKAKQKKYRHSKL